MSTLIDAETILMENEYWRKLEREWGKPIDLEVDTEEEAKLKPVFSTLDLIGTTFDSSFLFKKIRKKVSRKVSKKSTTSILDYKDFIGDLKKNPQAESSNNFYILNGQVVSATSVEKICREIDDVFKSIEKLSSATSTLRKIQKLPEVVQCSISTNDLSFDDTIMKSTVVEESTYDTEIDRHIDEALDQFHTSISSINKSLCSIERVDQSTLDSVTTLVRKFTSIISSPVMNCHWSPKRKRQCGDKFVELIEFWRNRALEAK